MYLVGWCMGLVDGYMVVPKKQIHGYSVYLSGILRTEKAPISYVKNVWILCCHGVVCMYSYP